MSCKMRYLILGILISLNTHANDTKFRACVNSILPGELDSFEIVPWCRAVATNTTKEYKIKGINLSACIFHHETNSGWTGERSAYHCIKLDKQLKGSL